MLLMLQTLGSGPYNMATIMHDLFMRVPMVAGTGSQITLVPRPIFDQATSRASRRGYVDVIVA
jgi:hypothetical protein